MPNFKQFYQGDTPAFRFEFKTKDGSALPEGIAAVFVIASKCGTDVFRNENLLDETGKTDFRIPKTVSDALKPGEYRWGVSLKYNAANADNADWQTPEGNGVLFIEANAAFPGADGASNAIIDGVFDSIVYEVNAYQVTGGGTSNYNELTGKPRINDVELSGNKTAAELGLADAQALSDVEQELQESVLAESQSRTSADNQLENRFNSYRTANAQDAIDNTKFNTADVPDYIITNIGMDTSNLQAVIINTTWWYKATGQQQTFLISLPFVSEEHPGIAPSELFNQVETLSETVQNVAKLLDVANALDAANSYTDNQILAIRNSTIHYVGDVATFDDLPADAQLFDLYHVLDTGNGYYWFGNKWEQIDFDHLSIDLSDYYTAAVVDERILAAKPGNFSLLKAGLIKGTADLVPTGTNTFGANDGKVFAENNGTGSLIGWGRLIAFIQGLYQAITAAVNRITTHNHSGGDNGTKIAYSDLSGIPANFAGTQAGGDLDGTYPNPTLKTGIVVSRTVGVAASPALGDSFAMPRIGVSSKGLTTLLEPVSITLPTDVEVAAAVIPHSSTEAAAQTASAVNPDIYYSADEGT